MRHVALTLLLVLLPLGGCIENMDDLKETLGVTAPPPPPKVYVAPVAKAQANVTSVIAGIPIAFLSEGSKDPQNLPLTYTWDFGDASRAGGATATHAYAQPGEYHARLTVANVAGLTDDDSIVVRVLAADRAPTAAIRILDASGAAVTRATLGAPLTLEAVAADPENGALALDWDLGDAATSHDTRVTHAYDAPGIYDARLTVTDRAGQSALATARIAIDGAWRASGAFEPAGADQSETKIIVARGATLDIQLAFAAGAGLNDLEIVVLDAEGTEVKRTSGEGEPGAQGEATRALTLGATEMAGTQPGAWTVRVLRERGLSAEWTLAVDERV